MFSFFEIFIIIFVHWFADFIMQDGEWAINKSKKMEALLKHTITYSLIWFIIVLFLLTPINAFIFFIVTFVAHTITDYYTSRYMSKQYQLGNFGTNIPRGFDFFVMLGFDQLLHYTQLFLTFYLLNN